MKKPLLISLSTLIGMLVIFLGYYQHSKNSTIELCSSLAKEISVNPIPISKAETVGLKNGFNVSLTGNNGTQALFYKTLTISGICIGKHKDGFLYEIKYRKST